MSEDVYNALLVFTLLNLVDIITTWNILRKHGVSRELNPLARILFEKFGVTGGFLLKYFGMGVTVLVALLTGQIHICLWIWNIILAGVSAWNSYVNFQDIFKHSSK